ncbi:helix-turn-helix transcriptional regulator [Flagellimonas sp. DF-77]|uniref:helix-turn-helix domain-containing protein n=1 Tax=Flagellimonas algarum TaxID=3230298 RepID=UPI0033926977
MAWHIIVFLFFAFAGIGLGVLFFFKKKGQRFANRLLGVYTLLFAYELLYKCLYWSGYLTTHEFVHFTFSDFPIWITYGPLVFWYVRHIHGHGRFRKTDGFFLIPIVAIVVLNLPFYTLGTMEKLDVLQQGTFAEHTWIPKGSIWVVQFLMFFYAVLTFVRFGPSRVSGFRENNWLKWFLGSYLGFVLAFSSYIVFTRFGWMDPGYDYLVDTVIVLFIGALAFFGFIQPEVFEGKPLKEIVPFVKYRKAGLSQAVSLEKKKKLETLMDERQLFLQSTLRLNDVADLLKLSRNHTSQVINQHFNLSFFDYVNRHRINAAKVLLVAMRDNDSNITQIAYDVGFNNRASFYKAFKKFENQNPSEYLKQRKAS